MTNTLIRLSGFDFDQTPQELIKENSCPKCGQPLRIWHEPNGNSDYNIMVECLGCGITLSD